MRLKCLKNFAKLKLVLQPSKSLSWERMSLSIRKASKMSKTFLWQLINKHMRHDFEFTKQSLDKVV